MRELLGVILRSGGKYISLLFKYPYTLIRPIACCISTFAYEVDSENALSPKSNDITTIQWRCRKGIGSYIVVLQRMKPPHLDLSQPRNEGFS